MKKIIVLTGIFFLTFISLFSQSYISFTDAGDVTDGNMQNLPRRDIVQYDNSVVVEYNIDGATVQNLTEDNTNYSLLKVEGFGLSNSEGYPSLPAYQDIIAVSQSSNVSVSIVSSTYQDFQGFTIYPSQGAALDIDTVIPFKINRAAYQTNSFYPGSLAEIKSKQDYKGIPLVLVQVNPVQYNPVTKTVRCYSNIKYRLTYGNASFSKTVNLQDSKLLHNIISNRQFLLDKLTIDYASSKNYIIVTTNKFLPAVERFAAWKRKTGFKTKILVQDSWTSEQVKEKVHTEYNSALVKPDYLLIVGDNEDVPGEYLTGGYIPHYSDLYYVCLGGDGDFIPDMAKGRIPVSTLDEANVVFDKIINYQITPPDDPDFYRTGVNCAYFQSYNRISAQRRFVKTCEEVRDYLISLGYKINRIYCTEDVVNPQFYNNDYYAHGEPLPEELKRPHFAWDGNNEDINDSINEGRFYVLHRDHGEYFYWGDPYYGIQDIDKLSNGNKLPVVFSLNCRTGAFNQPVCFSEEFIRRPHGGAVGIFCATELSISGFNDALAVGMFDAIWSEPGLVVRFGTQGIVNPQLNAHSDIYAMGDVLNQGLLRMSQTWSDEGKKWDFQDYTYELFHYFGDPSMEMYTGVPMTFSNVNVTQNGTSVTVSTGSVSDCKIVLCSKKDNGESYFSVAENTSSHTFTNVDVPCSICVMKHNYVP